jgi:hypothetical protein
MSGELNGCAVGRGEGEGRGGGNLTVVKHTNDEGRNGSHGHKGGRREDCNR